MDTHVHSEHDNQVTEPWNKGKLTGAKPPSSPETCLGGENAAPIIETLSGISRCLTWPSSA